MGQRQKTKKNSRRRRLPYRLRSINNVTGRVFPDMSSSNDNSRPNWDYFNNGASGSSIPVPEDNIGSCEFIIIRKQIVFQLFLVLYSGMSTVLPENQMTCDLYCQGPRHIHYLLV